MVSILKITKMSRAIMPSEANHRGILFGGVLLQWMDEISGITAKRFTETEVTTVAVEKVRFLKPIPVGAFLDVEGSVISVGNTSLRIRVTAKLDDDGKPADGEQEELAADAEFVYVALDDDGKPRKVERKLCE